MSAPSPTSSPLSDEQVREYEQARAAAHLLDLRIGCARCGGVLTFSEATNLGGLCLSCDMRADPRESFRVFWLLVLGAVLIAAVVFA